MKFLLEKIFCAQFAQLAILFGKNLFAQLYRPMYQSTRIKDLPDFLIRSTHILEKSW